MPEAVWISPPPPGPTHLGPGCLCWRRCCCGPALVWGCCKRTRRTAHQDSAPAQRTRTTTGTNWKHDGTIFRDWTRNPPEAAALITFTTSVQINPEIIGKIHSLEIPSLYWIYFLKVSLRCFLLHQGLSGIVSSNRPDSLYSTFYCFLQPSAVCWVNRKPSQLLVRERKPEQHGVVYDHLCSHLCKDQ